MKENELVFSKGLEPQTNSEAEPKPTGKNTKSKNGPPETINSSWTETPPFLGRLIQAFPYLKRHPHPFLVHFSIVFIYAAAFLNLLYLAIGHKQLEIAAFYCIGAGLVFLPPVMLTGEISRRLNYPKEPIQKFNPELHYSWILLLLWAGIFIWRWFDPSILPNFRWSSALYLLLQVAGVVLVTVISFHGGMLTFPLENNK